MNAMKLWFVALLAFVFAPFADRAQVNGFLNMRNDGGTLDQLRQKLGDLADRSTNVMNKADAEGRPMTKEELDLIEQTNSEFDSITAEIAQRERVEAMQKAVALPVNRQAQPPALPVPADAPSNRGAPASPGTGDGRISIVDRTVGNHGFNRYSDFLASVVRAGQRNAVTDPRLVSNAATTYGNEGSGADGGFAVPPDFRAAIVSQLMAEESLLARTDQMQSSSNAITIPLDETTEWQATGGIRAYWEGEAQQLTQSKPQLKELTVRLHKLTCLVPLTEELMQDAASMASYVQNRAPEIMAFRINDAIINGTGVGQPLGILNSAGTVSVAAESGQAADTINFQNLQKLYYRVRSESRRNAVWLMHPDVEEQLPFMAFPTSGGTVATPVYLPAGGASQAPFGTLFGRAIIPTEACKVLGDAGDVIFGDLRKYLTATKIGGIRSDISIHIYFDQDVTAFRFIFRVGGQPWRNSTITGYRAGSNARGLFGTVAERA